MNSAEIKTHIATAIRHTSLCQTQRKDNPDHTGPCTCYQEKSVTDLHQLVLQILKGNR